jgi:predicted O-methyltransferase YrrM
MRHEIIKEALIENPNTRMWLSGELELLYDLASETIGPIANLGCARGISAGVMAHASEYLVYSVDRYDGDHGSDAEKARDLWRRLDVTVEQCVGTTDEWAERLSERRFGLIFFDADHSYEGVKADYENWSPLLMPGGIVAFHDINKPGVDQLLHEIQLESVWSARRLGAYKWESN